MVRVRYIVNDINESVGFYEGLLGFSVVKQAGDGFAQLSYEGLTLLLNKPGRGGAGQAMESGDVPQPGGWNRIQIPVSNLEEKVKQLEMKGARFRNKLVAGNGGKQILIMDPSGNLVELFEPY